MRCSVQISGGVIFTLGRVWGTCRQTEVELGDGEEGAMAVRRVQIAVDDSGGWVVQQIRCR